MDSHHPLQLVREVSYAEDEGGIPRYIEPDGSEQRLVVSLTHLHVRRSLPFGKVSACMHAQLIAPPPLSIHNLLSKNISLFTAPRTS